jgi:hypothetical protein
VHPESGHNLKVFLDMGSLAVGQHSARSEGIANHSTGDLYGLTVGLPSKPGMEVESWRGGAGAEPLLFGNPSTYLNVRGRPLLGRSLPVGAI